jgi:hypothetical protein
MNVRQLAGAVAALDAKDAMQHRSGRGAWKLLAVRMRKAMLVDQFI